VRRLIREGVSRLEGEPLVITVTRAASLGGTEPVESATAGGSSTGAGGAKLVGWRGAAVESVVRTRIVRAICGRWGPASQLEQDPIQPCPQKARQRQRPIRECSSGQLCKQRADPSSDFNRGNGKRLECREDRRYSDSRRDRRGRERLNGKRNGKSNSQQLEPTETELRKGADDLLLSVSFHDGGRKEQCSQVGVCFEPENLWCFGRSHKPEIGVCLSSCTAPSFWATVGCRSMACCPHLAVVTPLPGLAIPAHAVWLVARRNAAPANGPRSSISRTLSAFSVRGQAARRASASSLMGSAAATAIVFATPGASAVKATSVVPAPALSTTLGTFSARLGALTGEVSLFSAVVTRAWSSSTVLDRPIRLDEGVHARRELARNNRRVSRASSWLPLLVLNAS
jgi:hypothetical protein